jgi:hypothetical protein
LTSRHYEPAPTHADDITPGCTEIVNVCSSMNLA